MRREPNFEVMRTVAMFFIVVYHCLTHGVGDGYGFRVSNPTTLSNLMFSDFLLVFSSIAVNLYVMVSGYFLVDLNFKMSRMVRTWTYACFYSFVITLLFMSLQIEPFSIVALGKSFFPISTDAYWFVTQYIGLLILSPFLAILVKQLSYKQYLWLLIGGAFICLALIPDFPLAKRFHVAHGNSVWSFAYLFLVAGYIKHYQTTTQTNFDPSGNKSTNFRYYLGPNHYNTLRAYDNGVEKNDRLYLKELVPLGWKMVSWINKVFVIPLFDLLSARKLNIGLIILLITIAIKVIILPFVFASYKSSAKMRVLKPQIDEINEKYPPEKMQERQQATMALYNRAGVNPMSGCLPLLFQMPVVMAVFWFFPTAIELR